MWVENEASQMLTRRQAKQKIGPKQPQSMGDGFLEHLPQLGGP